VSRPVLTVENFSVDYLVDPVVHAVRDVSFTLRRGEILGLAGESGCGKSTLAYGIVRLLKPPAAIVSGRAVFHAPSAAAPSSGVSPSSVVPPSVSTPSVSTPSVSAPSVSAPSVSAPSVSPSLASPSSGSVSSGGDVDWGRLGAEELRAARWDRISMVFQGAMNSLNPVISIRDQFEDIFLTHRPRMSRGERRQRCGDLLERVGVDRTRLRSYPHELSGGMRQRVMIAMAMALEPPIMIMDEPTTALDVVVQRDILREISRLRDELGFAVILITHDLPLLLEISDRIAVMRHGEIVELGDAAQIYTTPRHQYTRRLLASFPSLTGSRGAFVRGATLEAS
jgi:peptide/nickel transport system ATP-binding protein